MRRLAASFLRCGFALNERTDEICPNIKLYQMTDLRPSPEADALAIEYILHRSWLRKHVLIDDYCTNIVTKITSALRLWIANFRE